MDLAVLGVGGKEEPMQSLIKYYFSLLLKVNKGEEKDLFRRLFKWGKKKRRASECKRVLI